MNEIVTKMDIQSRKLHFIQEILALTNERIISKLEDVLNKEKLNEKAKPSIYDLVGVISEEEAARMEKEIDEACENINEEDWK